MKVLVIMVYNHAFLSGYFKKIFAGEKADIDINYLIKSHLIMCKSKSSVNHLLTIVEVTFYNYTHLSHPFTRPDFH
jgi:hypothetical protein